MVDPLDRLNALCEPISRTAAPSIGIDWSQHSFSDRPGCTVVGTNPQNAISDRFTLTLSSCTGFSPEGVLLRPSPLSSSFITPTKKASTRRSRKAREKDSDNLKGWQVNDLHHADAIADMLGLGMDWFVTITPLHISTFRIGLKRAGQWLRDHGHPFVYIYVHENPGGDRPHTHLLIHIPMGLVEPFVAQMAGWFGGTDETDVRVEPRTMPGWSRSGRLQYMIKGAHYIVCKSYGGHRKKGGQGPIGFKRSGVCQHLRNEFGGRNDTWVRPIHKRVTKLKILISGEELKALRRQAGLSQIELADLAGLHRNSVNRLENMGLIRGTSGHAVRLVIKALGEQIPEAYRA